MASTGTVLSTRIFAAIRSSGVAAQAGIAALTWASTNTPRVFRGFGGYLAGRNRGRLPFVEFDLEDQSFTHETLEGGTVTSTVRLAAHCSGRDLETAGNLLEGILGASLAAIRSEATDNYTALGNDQLGPLEPSPWGLKRQATLTIEHTFARSDYEVSGLPSTAVYHPTGALFQRSAAGLAVAGVVGDFTLGAWFRVDAMLEQYAAFFSLQKSTDPGATGKYFWCGIDSARPPATRGMGVFGSNGSHSLGDLLEFVGNGSEGSGTWFHAAVTKTGQQVRCYINGVLTPQESADYAEIGHETYTEINRIYAANEAGFGGLGHNGAVRAVFVMGRAMSQAQIAAAMVKSQPVTAADTAEVGAWLFTGSTDLGDALGGEAFTLASGTLGANTAGPAGITQP